MVKMIVTDMDGTLLDSQKKLPGNFTDVYRRIEEEGIQFVVASGRQFYTLVDEFSHLDHNMHFVAENGAFIHFKGESQVLNPMSVPGLTGILDTLEKLNDVHVVLCGKEGAYVLESNSDAFMDELQKYYKRNKVVSDLREVNDEILKVAICDFKHLDNVTVPALQPFTNDFQISTSSPIWVDINAKTNNKGVAVRYLQEQMGITANETMAFGDYLNDFEMLQAAGHSYAMANAHEDIKAVAKYQTVTNDEAGVVKAIECYLEGVS